MHFYVQHCLLERCWGAWVCITYIFIGTNFAFLQEYLGLDRTYSNWSPGSWMLEKSNNKQDMFHNRCLFCSISTACYKHMHLTRPFVSHDIEHTYKIYLRKSWNLGTTYVSIKHCCMNNGLYTEVDLMVFYAKLKQKVQTKEHIILILMCPLSVHCNTHSYLLSITKNKYNN